MSDWDTAAELCAKGAVQYVSFGIASSTVLALTHVPYSVLLHVQCWVTYLILRWESKHVFALLLNEFILIRNFFSSVLIFAIWWAAQEEYIPKISGEQISRRLEVSVFFLCSCILLTSLHTWAAMLKLLSWLGGKKQFSLSTCPSKACFVSRTEPKTCSPIKKLLILWSITK